MLQNEIFFVDTDIYFQILCTSPFVRIETTVNSIDILKSKEYEYDSATLCKNDKLYLWEGGSPKHDIKQIPNSVYLDSTIFERMSLYVIKRDPAKDLKRRIGERPFQVFASPIESIDVNTPEDFELASLIASGLREKKRKLLRNIKSLTTSSILSDILDELGYSNQVIKKLKPTNSASFNKVFGPASTLKLRRIKNGESHIGIYEALNSYDFIVPNDVIVIENELKENAYFGELNANLAIRSGASGVVLNGKTRDSIEVGKLGFPVFATGTTCQDVKRRAVVESMNKTIEIEGILVSPGTLVFADAEGIVIIPKAVEEEVLLKALTISSSEKKVLIDIATGVRVEEIIKNHGFF